MPTHNPNVTYEWIANKNFNFKNLKAKKGQRLPDNWQHVELVRRLKEKYGANSVLPRAINPKTPVEEPPPTA